MLFRFSVADVLLEFQVLIWSKINEVLEIMNELALVIITALAYNFKPIGFRIS
jgi:hypothetical protein